MSSNSDQSTDSAAEPQASSPLKSGLNWLLVLIPLGLSLWIGWLGIDFGNHWDQGHRVNDVQKVYEKQTLLPDEYNYPSVTFWLTMAASAPQAREGLQFDGERLQVANSFKRYLNSNEFQLHCRALFLLVSALATLWVFAASMSWRGRPLEALLAACLLAGSFEVSYHSRWVAPDAVMMQFSALCLFACMRAHFGTRPNRWLILAAVAAGLVAGTKYTGGILLIPVLMITLHSTRAFWPVLRAVLLFGLTFLVTTPGALLEPAKFLAALIYEMSHYASGHEGFSVEAGFEHFGKNLRYLLCYGPSEQPAISILMSLLAVAGCVGLCRDSKIMAGTVLFVIGAYVAYISSQSVMFVRNQLLFMPAFALLSARGMGLLWSLVPQPALRLGVSSAVVLGVVYNFAFNLQAAESIRTPQLTARLAEYLGDHPGQTIQLSPKVKEALVTDGFELPNNVRVAPAEDAQWLACYPTDLRIYGYWPSNDPDHIEAVLGPFSTNYDYYTTWWSPRIIVMDIKAAHEIAKAYPLPGIRGIFKDLVPVVKSPKGKD